MLYKNLCFALVLMIILGSCNTGDKKHYVTVETDYGDMTFELYNSTPVHRDNFLSLIKQNFYDDLLFHRVIRGFMIQGGDPDSKGAPKGQNLGMGGPGYTLPAEIGSPHFKGTLAAARTGGPSNPTKRSSGSQFYIVQGNVQIESGLLQMAQQKGINYNQTQIQKYTSIGGTPSLDMEYTVFGEIVDGMDVIDKIAAMPTGPTDRPLEDVKMKIRIGR